MNSGGCPRFRIVSMVFLAALLVGLAINAIEGRRSVSDLGGDEPDYYSLARNLADTGHYGLPDKLDYRAPGYPALLSLALKLGGASVTTGRMLQSILAALMVALAFVLGALLAGVPAGFLSAGMVMVETYWWEHQWLLLQENQLGVIAALFAILLWRLERPAEGSAFIGLACGAGAVLGLSFLTKPLILPLLGLGWLIPLCARPGRRARAAAAVAIVSLVSLLVVLPWSIRNRAVLGQPVFLTTGTGRVFLGAHSAEIYATPRLWGGWVPVDETSIREQLPSSTMTPGAQEVMLDRLRWRRGLAEIRAQPLGRTILLFLAKGLHTFSPSTFFPARGAWQVAIKAALWLINGAILAGFLLSMAKRRPGWWIGAVLMGSLLVTTVTFWGSIRLRYPLQPVIAAFSAAWWMTWRRRRVDRHRPPQASSAPPQSQTHSLAAISPLN